MISCTVAPDGVAKTKAAVAPATTASATLSRMLLRRREVLARSSSDTTLSSARLRRASARERALRRSPRPLADLADPPSLDLVHEPADLVLPRDEGTRLDARDRLAHVLLEVVEGLRSPLRLHAGLVLNLTAEFIVLEGQHSAVGVVDEHDLLRTEQPLRDRERADLVVGDHTSRVADHVGIALLEPEQRVWVQPRIHARDDRDPA